MKINVNTHVGVPSVVASVLYIKPDWRLAVALLLSLALALAQPVVFAQTVQPAPDNSVAASIAPYGAGVRQAILVASQYPETLAQLQKNSTQTQESFRNLVSRFDQKKQGWFYELTRYPGLLHALTTQSSTMKAVVFYGYGQPLPIEAIPILVAGPEQLLVQV